MSFNPDPNKQATEVIFSKKNSTVNHPLLYFNGVPVASTSEQKHLGLILDKKLMFRSHLNEKIQKANKGIGLIKRLYSHIPRKSLLNIYKSFIRPHLDYGDIIYDQPNNEYFCNMIESVQYNACLAITGAIKKSSRNRLYQELGIESLRDRRWYRRLVFFFKIVNGISPNYLRTFLPGNQSSYNPERSSLFRNITWNTDYFNNSFFPYCVREWNELEPELRNTKSISLFKKGLLESNKYNKPKIQSIFNIFDPPGIKLLTRLRVNLSHLREHKFKHNFLDTPTSLCSCGIENESTINYLLRCPLHALSRKTLLDNIFEIMGSISNLNDDELGNVLLYGNNNLNEIKNALILKSTIFFLKSAERFDIPLF